VIAQDAYWAPVLWARGTSSDRKGGTHQDLAGIIQGVVVRKCPVMHSGMQEQESGPPKDAARLALTQSNLLSCGSCRRRGVGLSLPYGLPGR